MATNPGMSNISLLPFTLDHPPPPSKLPDTHRVVLLTLHNIKARGAELGSTVIRVLTSRNEVAGLNPDKVYTFCPDNT